MEEVIIMKPEKNFRERIIDFLSENRKEFFSAKNISNATNVNIITITSTLRILRKLKKVSYKFISIKNNLVMINSKPMNKYIYQFNGDYYPELLYKRKKSGKIKRITRNIIKEVLHLLKDTYL